MTNFFFKCTGLLIYTGIYGYMVMNLAHTGLKITGLILFCNRLSFVKVKNVTFNFNQGKHFFAYISITDYTMPSKILTQEVYQFLQPSVSLIFPISSFITFRLQQHETSKFRLETISYIKIFRTSNQNVRFQLPKSYFFLKKNKMNLKNARNYMCIYNSVKNLIFIR